MNKEELLAKIKGLNLKDKDQRNRVVCALIGHSKIITICFGYVHCARCDAKIGDRLGGIFDTTDSVIVGHSYETCRKNYKKLTWKDKLYCSNPFKKESSKRRKKH